MLLVHGGTEVVPLLQEGLLEAETLVDVRGVVPRGVDGSTIGAGTTLAELEAEPAIPGRAARGVPARSVAAAAEHELARRQPPPVDALLVLAARLPLPSPRRRPLPRARRRAPRARDLRQRLLRLGAPLGRRGRTRRARRAAAHQPARARRSRSSTGSRTRATGARRRSRTASCCSRSSSRRWRRASTSRRWTASAGRSRRSASRRRGYADSSTRIALAGVAPIPWRIERVEELDAATPLPRTEWKVPLAQALVRRALAALG